MLKTAAGSCTPKQVPEAVSLRGSETGNRNCKVFHATQSRTKVEPTHESSGCVYRLFLGKHQLIFDLFTCSCDRLLTSVKSAPVNSRPTVHWSPSFVALRRYVGFTIYFSFVFLPSSRQSLLRCNWTPKCSCRHSILYVDS